MSEMRDEEALDSDGRRQKAVALQYTVGDGAPRVIASGAGELAKRIIELAEENGIPLKRDDSLVDILSRIDVGWEIPPETYRVVAEILAFLYRTDIAWRKKKEAEGLVVPAAGASAEPPALTEPIAVVR